MAKIRSWTDEQLCEAVKASKSYRAVLIALKLIPAGGNYAQVQRRIKELELQVDHFTGRAWNAGLKFAPNPAKPLEELLVVNGTAQSYVLKKRLFTQGIKKPACELCGWNQQALDGRIPVELDHMNGNHYDNRLENLRILCSNCHSLQPTHRVKIRKSIVRGCRNW